MSNSNNISSLYATSETIVTISDLKDDYFDGIELSVEQRSALKNFDRFKVKFLSASLDDADFQKRYLDLQRKENTEDYRQFLS